MSPTYERNMNSFYLIFLTQNNPFIDQIYKEYHEKEN